MFSQSDRITAIESFPKSEAPHVALDVVLVEDLTSDALLTRVALDNAHIPHHLQTLRAGAGLLPMLVQRRKNGEALPDVIILDLGLPGMDGFEILGALAAAHSAIRAVPVIILTGYEQFEYLCKSHPLTIHATVRKPCQPREFQKILAPLRRAKLGRRLH